jgi:hypothetical protein
VGHEESATEPHYGQRILDLIRSIDNDRIGILLRHSVRDHIPKLKAADGTEDARLTPLGHSEARRFGQLLPKGFNLVVSYSPVPRCVETAKGIIAGYSNEESADASDAGPDDSLAVMHFFTNDRKAMDSHKESVGGKRFLREWLDDALPPGMMRPPLEVKQFVSQSVARELKDGRAPLLRIWVGHDYGLIVVRELIFGGRFEEMPWISYLDGIVFAMDKEQSLMATWNGDPVGVAF